MWWKLAVGILVLTLIFFVIGLYCGSFTWLLLSGGGVEHTAWDTLFNAGAFSLTNRQKILLPWAWCVTVAVTFLPLLLTSLVFFIGSGGNKKLHGNARFANDRELRLFTYKGNYK